MLAFASWPYGGSELFYSVPGGGLFARTFSFKDGLTFGPEQALTLSNTEFVNNIGNGYRLYDISPDGKRFLMIIADDGAPDAPITAIVNWTSNRMQ